MVKAFPFTVFPLFVFNLYVFLFPEALASGWATEIAATPLFSGSRFVLTAGDAMIACGLFFLFLEMLRATIATSGALANHMASVIVLIVYAVEFAAVREAGNSVFFILTGLALVDVLAGFAVTSRVASRDVSLHDGY